MFLRPIPPPYDPLEWAKKPFAEKSRMVCEAWAMQGYGTPIAIYLLYLAKIAFYVAGWAFFCTFTSGWTFANIGDWWLLPEAFQKAILWSMLFEILGLGCGSGPLTGRYFPPVGGALYFLREGTTKLPVFEKLPLLGGTRRTWVDVALYAALITLTLTALVSPHPSHHLFVSIALLLPLLGLLDKTLFLAARGEHYWTTVAIFALATEFIPGAKAVHAALWFWAGISKLNHHFPSVVGVMTSNHPLVRLRALRERMYRSYPRDLRPSSIASFLGHAGTLLELSVPLVLLLANGGTWTFVGVVLALFLHGFITSNMPMGVPLEWNVMMVYGAFFLFWKHAETSLFLASPSVLGLVAFMCVVVPSVGNLYPARIPFLLAMRYYAGNWAYSVWLFKKGSEAKLQRLVGSSRWPYSQLERLYSHGAAVGILGKVIAFRLMHLHGRLLPEVLPRAVSHFEDYEWMDGEIIAGLALGWNFGDGHLHKEELLRAIQAQCAFDDGELRCVMVEAQRFFGKTLHFRIHDAKRGLLEEGHAKVDELRERQPWGTTTSIPSPPQGPGASSSS